ncbi:hypothetical protein [Brevundimonas sp.]|uniref:hypothetical protein n=1 Tax=Brevundimonas sp. TaxID=1871086 RepID=UPI00262099AF|nr:hypothetical protein [Brevundimonas sp.]
MTTDLNPLTGRPADCLRKSRSNSPIHSTNFSFRNRTVSLSAADPAAGRRLASLLGLRAAPPGPADHLLMLRETARGLEIQSDDNVRHVVDLDAAIASLAQSIPYWLLPHQVSHVLHAGAIVVDGLAHLFMGPGYAGKSTLALEAWLMGHEVMGDDYLILDPATLTVRAAPKPIKVRRPSRSLPVRLEPVLAPDHYCMGRLGEEWALLLGRQLPRQTPLESELPIGSVHFLQRVDGATVASRPVRASEFYQLIFHQLVTAPLDNLDVPRSFAPLLAGGRIFSLGVGTDATPLAVDAILAHRALV